MNLFKRPAAHYGNTPQPETPYQKAAQIWDERIGSARVQAKNWRYMAFGSLILSAGFAAALAWQSVQGTVVPWIVQVDKLGQAQAIAPATADYKPTDPQVAWHLARFIEQGSQNLSGHRMGRAGDQSFWGIGIPSMFMGMGEQPIGAENPLGTILGGGGHRKSAGFGWWWHTPEDTLDKMDPDVHRVDTRIYVHALWRLLSDAALPMDYRRQIVSLRSELQGLAGDLGDKLDLTRVFTRLDALGERLSVAAKTKDIEALNRSIMRVSRALVPVDYTEGDRFDHDPALGQLPYPMLDPVRSLAATLSGTDEEKFASVAARRAVNRLSYALDKANRALD